jgi:hypothetical protein
MSPSVKLVPLTTIIGRFMLTAIFNSSRISVESPRTTRTILQAGKSFSLDSMSPLARLRRA